MSKNDSKNPFPHPSIEIHCVTKKSDLDRSEKEQKKKNVHEYINIFSGMGNTDVLVLPATSTPSHVMRDILLRDVNSSTAAFVCVLYAQYRILVYTQGD